MKIDIRIFSKSLALILISLMMVACWNSNFELVATNTAENFPTPLSTSTPTDSPLMTPTPTSYLVPKPTPMHPIFDNFCEPPCWEGIIPGATTEEEALQLLRQSKFVNPDSIRAIPLYESVKTLRWENRSDKQLWGGFVNIDRKSGKVYDIIIEVGGSTKSREDWNIKLQTAIERWGEPDWIVFESAARYIDVHFYYDNIGLGFRVDTPDYEYPTPSHILYEVYFFDIKNSDKFCHPFSCDRYLSIYEWKGFDYLYRSDIPTITLAP